MEKNSGWHVCIILALIAACYVNTRAVAKVAALLNFKRNYFPGCNATIKLCCDVRPDKSIRTGSIHVSVHY